ncbi:MAG: hypothetical protein J6X94_13130 [Lachnospiraceae bacterium]|nr:hypothetical protein [Lachnospiraceae bacterium]
MSRHKKKNRKNNASQTSEEIKNTVTDEVTEEEISSETETEAEETDSEENVTEGSASEEVPAEDDSTEVSSEEVSDEEQPSEEETPSAETQEDDDVREALASAEDEDSEDKTSEEKTSEEKDSKPEKSPEKEKKEKKVSRDALREQTENERLRREARHRKRIRQQVTAYVILVIILALIGCGLFFGIKFFVNIARERRAAQAAAELEAQQQLEAQAQEQAQTEPVNEEPPAPTVEDLGPTPMEQLDALIASDISSMTLEEKIQGLMFITPESITHVDRVMIAGEGTAAALSDFCPGGIIYSAKNVSNANQFSEMMATTSTLVSRPVFLATSETGLNESGLVGAGVITSSMTPADAAATGDVEQVVNVGINVGVGLHSVGITVDFAPVADLSVTAGGIGANATYGNDAAAITPYVTAMADGLMQSGVTPVYRYFPSLAACGQNPLWGRAVSDRSIEDFRSNEFQVWLSAINAGASMIQMSNVIYPSIDSDSLPSSLSDKTVTGVLRDELKYDGVIISGPLSDAAITSYYTASDAAVMALKAGCDMIYSSPDPRAAVQGILDAVAEGVISEQRIDDALTRIYRVRYADELERLRGEYEQAAASMGVDLTGVQY